MMSHRTVPILTLRKRQSFRAVFGLAALCLLLSPVELQSQFARDQSVGRTLRLVLHPWGFEPDEITIAPGPIAVEVVNRVGLPELDLRLEVEQGTDKPRTSLLQERFFREEPKWRNVFVFPAGQYTVSVGANEKWVARITVKGDGAKP